MHITSHVGRSILTSPVPCAATVPTLRLDLIPSHRLSHTLGVTKSQDICPMCPRIYERAGSSSKSTLQIGLNMSTGEGRNWFQFQHWCFWFYFFYNEKRHVCFLFLSYCIVTKYNVGFNTLPLSESLLLTFYFRSTLSDRLETNEVLKLEASKYFCPA